RRYFEQETNDLPQFFVERVRRDLGPLYQWLPVGALNHDSLAYLAAEEAAGVPSGVTAVAGARRAVSA
ncbi:MAG TPA: hypothetical protein VIV56_12465, partial [Gemmatimonadales bacterium]